MRRPFVLAVVVVALFPSVGRASGAGKLIAEIASAVLKEVLDSQIGTIAVEIFNWTLLGAVAGSILAVVAFFAIRALGGYGWKWKHAGWFRILTMILMLLLCSILLGAAGCAEGTLRGSEIAVRESQIGTKLLPRVGEAGADLLAALYLNAPKLAAGEEISQVVPTMELEKFHQGAWKLDPAELERRLDKMSADVANQASEKLKGTILAELPEWRGGIGQMLLDWLLPVLAKQAVGEDGRAALEHLSARPLLVDLKAVAARGDGTLTYEQFSTYLTQKVVIPAVMRPIRSTLRGAQRTQLILLVLVLLVPVAFFRGAEYLRARNAPPVVRVVLIPPPEGTMPKT